MQYPLQVSFRQMPHSSAIESLVWENAAQLNRYAEQIQNCHVVIESLGVKQKHGKRYHVEIDLSVPGEDIEITSESSEHLEHTNIRMALRDAFDSAHSWLADFVSCPRGIVPSSASAGSGSL